MAERIAHSFRAAESVWTRQFRPLEAARRKHREARHSRDRRFLARYVRPGGVGAEVGVFWAHFSEVLVRDFAPSKLYLIDPWDRLHGEYFNWKSPYTLQGALKTETAFASAERLRARHPGVVEIRKEYSTEFFSAMPDETFDWVYLDATHKYREVLADLECIWPKLKRDGLLMGDDYFEEPDAKHSGTRKAVDEFAAAHGVELVKEDHYQYILPRAEARWPAEKE